MKFSDRSDALTIHPFAYFTCDRDRNVKGYSAGASAELPISEDTRLTATAEYNNNDIIESAVKGQGNGFNITFGATKTF